MQQRNKGANNRPCIQAGRPALLSAFFVSESLHFVLCALFPSLFPKLFFLISACSSAAVIFFYSGPCRQTDGLLSPGDVPCMQRMLSECHTRFSFMIPENFPSTSPAIPSQNAMIKQYMHKTTGQPTPVSRQRPRRITHHEVGRGKNNQHDNTDTAVVFLLDHAWLGLGLSVCLSVCLSVSLSLSPSLLLCMLSEWVSADSGRNPKKKKHLGDETKRKFLTKSVLPPSPSPSQKIHFSPLALFLPPLFLWKECIIDLLADSFLPASLLFLCLCLSARLSICLSV